MLTPVDALLGSRRHSGREHARMDRGAPAEPLSWLLLPAAAMLLASALSLPLSPIPD
jgi:hypothetical protein